MALTSEVSRVVLLLFAIPKVAPTLAKVMGELRVVGIELGRLKRPKTAPWIELFEGSETTGDVLPNIAVLALFEKVRPQKARLETLSVVPLAVLTLRPSVWSVKMGFQARPLVLMDHDEAVLLTSPLIRNEFGGADDDAAAAVISSRISNLGARASSCWSVAVETYLLPDGTNANAVSTWDVVKREGGDVDLAGNPV